MKTILLLLAILILATFIIFPSTSTPSHNGMTRIHDGGKHVSGWTNWNGVYHYTRAILHGYDDSGRQWGWHYTSAGAFGSGVGAMLASGTTHWGY